MTGYDTSSPNPKAANIGVPLFIGKFQNGGLRSHDNQQDSSNKMTAQYYGFQHNQGQPIVLGQGNEFLN